MNNKRKLDYDEIASLYKSGLSQADISSKIGCSRPAVSKILKYLNIESRSPLIYDRERIVSLYESGASLDLISKTIGCCVSVAFNILRNSGIKMHPRRKLDYAAVCQMYAKGISSTQIADTMNCTHTAILKAIKRSGVETRLKGDTFHSQHLGNKGIDPMGYVTVNVGKNTKQREHRIIAERALGRPFRRLEVVHHINEDRSDNRPENLLICTHKYHLALHARMRRNNR